MNLSAVLTAFCVCAITIGALYIICPEGTMSKPLKYILSLAFILTVITATTLTVKKPDIPEFDYFAHSQNTEQLEVGAAEYVYATALKAADIDFRKIIVCTDKTETSSISISKVIIYSDCDEQRIIAALGEAAQNYEVEIINE